MSKKNKRRGDGDPEEFGPRAGTLIDSEPERNREPFTITFIEENRPQAEVDEIGGLLASPEGRAASRVTGSAAGDPRSPDPDADAPEARDR